MDIPTTENVDRDEGNRDSTNIFVNILATSILTVGLMLYALHNLGNRYFWTDEASSFFTTLGFPAIGQFSSELSSPWGVIEGHIEPGMFNLVERYWATWIGTEIWTLRTFPFLLFIGYLVSILLLSRIVGAQLYLGCAAVGLILLENITPYYAVELRPSVAGLAATVILPLAAIWLTMSKSKWLGLSVFILLFVFFGSMQYNSFPIVIGISAMLIVASLNKSAFSRRFALRFAALLILLWLPLIYVLQVGNPFSLAGGDYFTNIPDVYLPNMTVDQALRTIFTNLFSPTALPRTIFLILVPALWIAKYLAMPSRESTHSEWAINGIWVAVFFGTLMSAIAGIFGFLPWILGTRWSISEVGLIALSLVGLAGLISRVESFKKMPIRLIAVVLSLLACFSGSYRFATFERTPGFDWSETLQTILSGDSQDYFIDNWTYVEVRYWVEYSGQYDQFREAWIDSGVRSVGGMDKVDSQDIQDFLTSDAGGLLLRSENLLEGIELPSDVRIQPVASWGKGNPLVSDRPVLLVRE